ncbi:Undecaprenyl-phosphate galactose phosphotransferase, WbaP/exopolysaccharide biosynthesis polyprenyl glycosylphosphotransferase [Blastococcus sp. DSM 46786]|uniref:sugar transferase n=1 Tax=Blastococcus sp. DSM 46786 TaxID=1798227 RepID=UPI0008CCAB08|nr:sugar transferase [Blastococcus sp. DSM 46786]SEL63799.1 Undecaprenyl-phosphate galactose phosphotransferase, WbaP/exopolysaccharide biosynthesis polyprenyl glycosylphosphotransferase [Blastococcus sp. DSM 46786]
MQVSHDQTTREVLPATVRTRFPGLRRLRGEGTEARRAWRTAYVRSIVLGDAVAAVLAATIGYFGRFGTDVDGAAQYSLWAALAMPAMWVAAMHIGRSYEERFLWVGAEEFRRVLHAAAVLLAAVAVVSWGLDLRVARGFVVIALPLATVLTLLQRYLRRQALHRARNGGAFQQTTVVVGHRNAVASLHAELDRAGYHGYRVIGCCLPDGKAADGPTDFDGLPVLGGLDEVLDVVQRFEVDTVAVMPCPELDGPSLRRLGWDLEKTEAELLLAPAVTEVVGPRVAIRPVCGLPLLHVERPELRGVRRLAKTAVDASLAATALLVTLPLFLVIALALKTTSRGPVFFEQTRVGRDGQTFSMLKFRSMVHGADRMAEVLEADNDGNGVLYKRKVDPRVTRVGRLLRRYSLDELPQLINVLRGDMSLVGPRPPLPSETERYGFDMRRRFLVKPGITGLWQISGRSDLSWDDSVRIDVRYVENWSLSFDMMILWKTLGAVLRGRGAY